MRSTGDADAAANGRSLNGKPMGNEIATRDILLDPHVKPEGHFRCFRERLTLTSAVNSSLVATRRSISTD